MSDTARLLFSCLFAGLLALFPGFSGPERAAAEVISATETFGQASRPALGLTRAGHAEEIRRALKATNR